DAPEHGPNEDLARLDVFVSETGGSWTLVWLPHFFSESSKKLLGELVILEHILSGADSKRKYLQHLSVEHQNRAELDLNNLRVVKRKRLTQVLEQAYGLASIDEDALDPGARVEQQLRLLKPGATMLPQLAATLSDVKESYVTGLL